MPATYTLIASNTLSSAAASVTFSAIPGTYTDLVVRMTARSTYTTSNWDFYKITFNNNTSGVYGRTTLQALYASGSYQTQSGRGTSETEIAPALIGANATSNTFASTELYLPNYAGSTNKPVSFSHVNEWNASTTNNTWSIAANAYLFASTTAITSIEIASYYANLVSGSSFFLYGIKNS